MLEKLRERPRVPEPIEEEKVADDDIRREEDLDSDDVDEYSGVQPGINFDPELRQLNDSKLLTDKKEIVKTKVGNILDKLGFN